MTLTQRDVELTMYHGGIERARESMARAEEAGEAARNPYAATLFRDFVLPLAELIKEEMAKPKPGMRAAHVALLRPLDPEAVAYLAVRTTINTLMQGSAVSVRRAGKAIGTAVHSELVLSQFAELAPDLYHTLVRDFGRKLSKSARHRMTVVKLQLQKEGIKVDEWGVGARDQVGLYALDLLQRLGLIVLQPGQRKGGKGWVVEDDVLLASDVSEQIEQIKGYVEVTMPVYGPCVEPPRDWTTINDGGFHTDEMRRTHRSLVKAPGPSRARLQGHDMPIVLAAVNALQRTAWCVNGRILDAVRATVAVRDVGEIALVRENTKPPAPAWLRDYAKGDVMTEGEEKEFKTWKRAMAEWYTQRQLTGVKYGRLYSATRSADMFRNAERLHFVYFADSRGRLYPLTYGVNPQGSDLQKSLLHFADAKPLGGPEGERWFLIHGANKWGFDKATLEERARWHEDKRELILAFADNPVDNHGWDECDNPLQFLAWCFEYAEWVRNPDTFRSRIPISMDGSCNGLQNFSAMLRDEVGGRATNLTDNAVMEDIYRRVAEAATKRMKAATSDDPLGLRRRWLEHGIDRSVVKRSVMTTPYGITRRSAVQYVVGDYLSKRKAPCFEPAEYFAAAQCLLEFAWPAIGDVVVKSREAMDWLKACAKVLAKSFKEDEEGVLTWVTPSGFLATQAYYEFNEHRINTKLHGSCKIKVVTDSDEPAVAQHGSGLAPNFVHSMDASHLHLVAAHAASLGIDALAMIHDDYGTHACNAQSLYTLIRVSFVDMYTQHDPIQQFYEEHPSCPKPPDKGTLDLNEVLYSQFFFS